MTKLKVAAIVLAVMTMLVSCSKEEVIQTKNNKETGDQSNGQNAQGSGG